MIASAYLKRRDAALAAQTMFGSDADQWDVQGRSQELPVLVELLMKLFGLAYGKLRYIEKVLAVEDLFAVLVVLAD